MRWCLSNGGRVTFGAFRTNREENEEGEAVKSRRLLIPLISIHPSEG
ncbi:unnamed protein product [Tenebrio molitor]|jgi:hypothetical protein|nr:unnamed protein product [Tenebrio molitor]